MTTLLKNLIKSWKTVPEYTDVDAVYWQPDQPQIISCPNGCDLEIYEAPPDWIRISGYDAYRQTRICRRHGYARIYVITGPDAWAHNWRPQDDFSCRKENANI